jgi:hypothetical protein
MSRNSFPQTHMQRFHRIGRIDPFRTSGGKAKNGDGESEPCTINFPFPTAHIPCGCISRKSGSHPAGQRKFHISINGQQVAANFDIVQAAGGPKRAVYLDFPVNVTGGTITIQMAGVVSDPKINGIEVLP